MTDEVVRATKKDTPALAGEQVTQVMCMRLKPGVFLRLLDESAWQPPRLQSDPEVQPALDAGQASSLPMSPGNGGFSNLMGAYPDST